MLNLTLIVFFVTCTASLISIVLGTLAAYALSRFTFKAGFVRNNDITFFFISQRIMPPIVLSIPFFIFLSTIGLLDSLIGLVVVYIVLLMPIAVWIMVDFFNRVPKELDETAYVDGYSFWRFFFKIFIPTITAGIGITMFFCFMFSWVELLLAKTLTAVAAKPIAATMTRTASTSGYELGLLAAAGSLTIIPGAIVIYFVSNYIAKGFALGRV